MSGIRHAIQEGGGGMDAGSIKMAMTTALIPSIAPHDDDMEGDEAVYRR
jgi:hypothetical protein